MKKVVCRKLVKASSVCLAIAVSLSLSAEARADGSSPVTEPLSPQPVPPLSCCAVTISVGSGSIGQVGPNPSTVYLWCDAGSSLPPEPLNPVPGIGESGPDPWRLPPITISVAPVDYRYCLGVINQLYPNPLPKLRNEPKS